MSFTAEDALKLFEIDWNEIRARYITNNLEYKIESVFNYLRSITIDGVINQETDKVSILFPKYLLDEPIHVGLTKDIFDILKDHGYDIHYEYTFDESNKYNDNSNLYKNSITIDWSNANEKTINLRPEEIEMITAQSALNHYKELDRLADKFINEIIVPKIKKVAKTQKFIKFNLINVYYLGYLFNYFEDNNKEAFNLELSKLIFDKLRKNHFKLNFYDETSSTKNHNGKSYVQIRWG